MPAASQPQPGLLDAWGRRNRKHAPRSCAECGGSFFPKRASSSYCSVPCARKKNGGHNAKLESWWINSRGYVEGRILTAQGQRKVKRHRFVVECLIGRKLLPHEDVHHRNGIKTDNEPENLELLSHGAHSTLTNNERHAKARGEQ